jgi:hypothetical protein
MIVSDYLTDCCRKQFTLFDFTQPNRYQLPPADVETVVAQYLRVSHSERNLSDKSVASIKTNVEVFLMNAQKAAEARATAAAQIEVLNDDN